MESLVSNRKLFSPRILVSAIFLVIGSDVWAADTANTLPTITVKAENNRDRYTVQSSRSSAKLDLNLKDTPQSLTVFTQQQIEDQNLIDISKVLEETPGVSKSQHGQEGAGFSDYYARGFKINNFMRDGIPTSAASFGGTYNIGMEDTAIYDRIEILKGASGLLGGSGNPSASINYVRKRATEDTQGSIKVQAGSWERYRSQFDVSGGLNADKTLKGRLIAAHSSGGNQQDRYHKDSTLLYGTVDYDLSDQTTLTTALSLQQNKIHNAAQHGFPFVSGDGLKQTTFGPRDNPATHNSNLAVNNLYALLGVEHQFNSNWKGAINYSYSKTDSDQIRNIAGYTLNYQDEKGIVNGTDWEGKPIILKPGEMSVHGSKFINTPEVHAIDSFVSGQFQALGREHELSFGINGYKVNANDPAYKVWQFSSRPIQNYHGDVGDYINLTPIGRTITDEYQIGGFASAKLQLADPVKLILGSRLSTWERKNTGTEQKQSNIYTPYVGLILDINDQISAYASYTSIFNPSTRKNVTGQFLDPEEGNSVEIGLKAEFFNQRLNTNLAYFETKQDNFAVRDGEKFTTDGEFAYIAVNGAKVKGVELSVAGELNPYWHISAGYTYTDAKDRDGKTLTTATGSSLPRQTLKLFTNYQWDKLTLGAGVNWQSEIFDTRARGVATQFNRQDDYVLLNLMGRYQINPDLSLAINVDNVGNTIYKRTAINTWGELRNFMATLNYKF